MDNSSIIDSLIACRDTGYKCLNGGTCINFKGSPRCECPAGTYGKYCDIGKIKVIIIDE